AIITLYPLAEDAVGGVALAPEILEITRITLAVRVDLENPFDGVAPRGGVVSEPARSAMARVRLVYHDNSLRITLLQAGENIKSIILRSVVNEEKLIIDSEIRETITPFADDFFDGGGFVVDRNDDRERSGQGRGDLDGTQIDNSHKKGRVLISKN